MEAVFKWQDFGNDIHIGTYNYKSECSELKQKDKRTAESRRQYQRKRYLNKKKAHQP